MVITSLEIVPPASGNDDFAALESFLVNNPDLERLEALGSRFNVFAAMGVVRHELRHSDFLGFLLDPRQSHGLGDAFAKRLLQRALQLSGPNTFPLTPIHVDLMDLGGLSVRREWQSIDILLLDEINRLAIVIENKIDSTEHSNQLDRYWELVTQDCPDWRVVGLYVTPDGDIPSHEGYMPISYEVVAELIEQLTERRASNLEGDVRMTMLHYTQMLRRHIVAESEVALLCRQIYQKHRQALDLIFEHRPDQQSWVRDSLEGLIGDTEGLILDSSSKAYINFLPKEWNVPWLRQGLGWVPSGRMLLFAFENRPQKVVLRLYIGPGPEDVRRLVFDLACSSGPPYKVSWKVLGKKWNTLYQREFLNAATLSDAGAEDLEVSIKKAWATFVDKDLPLLRTAMLRTLADLKLPDPHAAAATSPAAGAATSSGTD